MSNEVPVISIDGPVAVGKGSVSRLVAAKLGFTHLNSGLLYRLVGWRALQAGADLSDPAVVLNAVGDVLASQRALQMALREPALTSDAAGDAGSAVALLPEVRAALLAPQRCMRQPPGVVAEGRDMGSIVFVDATLKVFLDASCAVREQRAVRRAALLQNDTITDSVGLFRVRDKRDRQRRIAPVQPAAGAHRICTDSLTVDETVTRIVELYRQIVREADLE